MIHLILADAEIEPLGRVVPSTGEKVRVCGTSALELEGVHILDSYLHHPLVEGLEQAERRGRPDIVHSFLLLTQSSRPFLEGRMRVLVHTRGDEVICFGPKSRVESSYVAFLRSMSELFERCALGTEEAGIMLREHQPLAELLEGIGPEIVIALSPTGEKVPLEEVFAQLRGKETVIMIGGFLEGDYRSPVYEMADRSISLGEELLTVPDVTAQVLAALS